MPVHLTVARHGDAVQALIAHISGQADTSVHGICRRMAENLVIHITAFLPGVDAPDVAKKAASLRRQWYRWASGQHVPDTDDLGCLLRVARQAGWWPVRGVSSVQGVAKNVLALVADVDAAEDGQRSLAIERALETRRLELESLSAQIASITRTMPGGLHDVGVVLHDLVVKVLEEVSPNFPLGGGAAALRAAAGAIDSSLRRMADDVEIETRQTEVFESRLVDFENDDALLKAFEREAGKSGLWPEDLNELWRWVKLGPYAGAAPVDRTKLRTFLRLLDSFEDTRRPEERRPLRLVTMKPLPAGKRVTKASVPKAAAYMSARAERRLRKGA